MNSGLCWGKLFRGLADDGEYEILPLEDHCLDVALVFRELGELPGVRRSLNKAAGAELDNVALDRLSVLAMIHDLGKCNWGFQAKKENSPVTTAGHTRETCCLFTDRTLNEKVHRRLELDSVLNWFEKPDAFFSLFVAAASHHGRPAFTWQEAGGFELSSKARFWIEKDEIDPFAGLDRLWKTCRRAFPGAFVPEAEPIPFSKKLEHVFAGLVMLADWLGSHAALFPIRSEESRILKAAGRAKRALEAIGLDISVARNRLLESAPDFREVFGFAPNPLQFPPRMRG